ncbi:hypothetical protein DM02DRAFT_671697, partial [Periconia macrospinosa]
MLNVAAPLLISIVYGSILAVAGNEAAPSKGVHDKVGWQNNPGRRGTWDIVWSCATTIFACTWSIQHLNVPGPHDGTIRKLLRSCKWMVITILFPEFILVHAFFELAMAIQATELVKERTSRKVAEYPWLIKILFFRNQALNRQQERDNEDNQGPHNALQEPEWTLTHSYFANMGGFYYEQADTRSSLTASQYAQEPDLYDIPMMEEEYIKDKGKQDLFAKGIAILQILQLVLSLIVRATRRLRFSQLEMITLVFAVCGVFTYVAYWYKPTGVGVPIAVTGRSSRGAPKFNKTYDGFWDILTNSNSFTDVTVIHRIKNDNIPLSTSHMTHVAIPILAVISAAFGCLHLIAWNFEFPTEVEKLLWHIGIVLSITAPVIGLVTIPLAQIVIQDGNPRDFMRDCLYVLRELSWYSPDRSQMLDARERLENIFNNPDTRCDDAQQLYRNIFENSVTSPTLDVQMSDFIDKNAPFEDRMSLELPEGFQRQFTRLLKHMKGNGPKKLVENAKTNVFPQQSLLGRKVNLFILYTTSLAYCLSRLTIMALALSSLRYLPDDVNNLNSDVLRKRDGFEAKLKEATFYLPGIDWYVTVDEKHGNCSEAQFDALYKASSMGLRMMEFTGYDLEADAFDTTGFNRNFVKTYAWKDKYPSVWNNATYKYKTTYEWLLYPKKDKRQYKTVYWCQKPSWSKKADCAKKAGNLAITFTIYPEGTFDTESPFSSSIVICPLFYDQKHVEDITREKRSWDRYLSGLVSREHTLIHEWFHNDRTNMGD